MLFIIYCIADSIIDTYRKSKNPIPVYICKYKRNFRNIKCMLYLSVTNKLFLIKITAKRFGTALLKKTMTNLSIKLQLQTILHKLEWTYIYVL